MAHINSNPNPKNSIVGDCVVRAIAIATGRSWQDVYMKLCLEGLTLADMPSSNRVWGEYLKSQGYIKTVIPDTCPDCYTVRDFCGEHFKGRFILGTGTHAVAVIDGNYYDTWDSGDEVVIYYWHKKGENDE